MQTAETYRRSVWLDQESYVEIWVEKEALAGVFYRETAKWDCPLMVTKGYPSLSYVHSAAKTIEAIKKPAYLYYFGDYDPSGVDIARHTEERLRELAGGAEIHFERVAVTPAQIDTMKLQTRPTKKSDSRSKNFEGESVELDAIPPAKLRELVRECVERHIDTDVLDATKLMEEAERESLHEISRTYDDEN